MSEAFHESHNGHHERVKDFLRDYQYEKPDSIFHPGWLLTLRFQEGNNREGDAHLSRLMKTERGMRAV